MYKRALLSAIGVIRSFCRKKANRLCHKYDKQMKDPSCKEPDWDGLMIESDWYSEIADLLTELIKKVK